MEKRTTASLFIVGILVTAGIATSALACQGDSCQWSGKHAFVFKKHVRMERALRNKDYGAWQKVMAGRGQKMEIINKDNFSKLAQIHNFVEAGKFLEADQARRELGLGLRNLKK
jgi:hypothetical protein